MLLCVRCVWEIGLWFALNVGKNLHWGGGEGAQFCIVNLWGRMQKANRSNFFDHIFKFRRSMKTTNITEEVRAILGTVHTLDGKFGAGYVNRLLRADDKFPIREPHRALPTYGVLAGINRERVKSLINWLIVNRYLSVSMGEFPVVSLSPKGQEQLQAGTPLEATWQEINNASMDVQLLETLRNMRRSVAEERNIALYFVFTDASMDEIVRQKPETPEALAQIPGMSEVKVKTYGEAILGAVQQHQVLCKETLQQQLAQRAASPRGQEIRRLHEAGLAVDAISEQMQLKRSTVELHLEALHLTHQINLVNWVAQHLHEMPALNMGIAYFRKWRDARLTEAQQALGLDYYTLRLCRWYALAA